MVLLELMISSTRELKCVMSSSRCWKSSFICRRKRRRRGKERGGKQRRGRGRGGGGGGGGRGGRGTRAMSHSHTASHQGSLPTFTSQHIKVQPTVTPQTTLPNKAEKYTSCHEDSTDLLHSQPPRAWRQLSFTLTSHNVQTQIHSLL